jgi:hypothetical protein
VEFLIVLAVLAVVVFVVTAPLRRERGSGGEGEEPADRERTRDLAELEAAREAKYREIRDADLDHRTGKLSDADFEAIDRALRAEAVEILWALDRAGGAEQAPNGGAEQSPNGGAEQSPNGDRDPSA